MLAFVHLFCYCRTIQIIFIEINEWMNELIKTSTKKYYSNENLIRIIAENDNYKLKKMVQMHCSKAHLKV